MEGGGGRTAGRRTAAVGARRRPPPALPLPPLLSPVLPGTPPGSRWPRRIPAGAPWQRPVRHPSNGVALPPPARGLPRQRAGSGRRRSPAAARPPPRARRRPPTHLSKAGRDGDGVVGVPVHHHPLGSGSTMAAAPALGWWGLPPPPPSDGSMCRHRLSLTPPLRQAVGTAVGHVWLRPSMGVATTSPRCFLADRFGGTHGVGGERWPPNTPCVRHPDQARSPRLLHVC